MDPPSLPLAAVAALYTGCYCEENVYLLAQMFSEDPEIAHKWAIFVVFISNHTKTVS